MLNNFVFYIFFCSSVLIYGIGFNRAAIMCNTPKRMFVSAIKSYICVVMTFCLCFVINKMVLLPLNIIEIFPIIALLIFVMFCVFLEVLIQITTKKVTSEFAISFLTILLALSEGITIVDGIFICISCLTSFYLLLPILFSLEKRLVIFTSTNVFKRKCFIFLCMIVVLLALYSFNASWLTAGVIK